jgi:hypothetical protein
MRTRPRSQRRRDDRGQITPALVVLVLGAYFALGLVVDGGRSLGAYVRAHDLAQSAARAGAQATQPDDLAVGTTRVDAASAEAAVAEFMATAGNPGSANVTVNGTEVTVTVTVTQSMLFLPPGGSRQFSGRASTTATRGVEAGEIR